LDIDRRFGGALRVVDRFAASREAGHLVG